MKWRPVETSGVLRLKSSLGLHYLASLQNSIYLLISSFSFTSEMLSCDYKKVPFSINRIIFTALRIYLSASIFLAFFSLLRKNLLKNTLHHCTTQFLAACTRFYTQDPTASDGCWVVCLVAWFVCWWITHFFSVSVVAVIASIPLPSA